MRKLQPREMDRLSAAEYRQSEKQPFVFLLDNVRSALNAGSVFRTADAFRFSGVYLSGITAKPPHRDILKTALGATESVPWQYFDSAVEAARHLKKSGYRIISVEQTTTSIPLQDFRVPGPVAFVLGNEVNGICESVIAMSDAAVIIPQAGTKHSLNVAVCAGIVAWDQAVKLGK